MITCEESRCSLSGPITVDTAGGVLRELLPKLAQGVTTLDLSGVEAADSAAIALVFSAMRQARQSGASLVCTGLPPSFTTLAELYGVADLLPA